MSFEEEQLTVLKETAQGLSEELEGHPSPLKVQGLVAHLVRAAVGFCGPGILAELGRALVEYERINTGYCKMCPGSPRPATNVDDLCDDCRVKFNNSIARMGIQEPSN